MALLNLDPLGIDPQTVSRLESIFRLELGRIDVGALLSEQSVKEVLTRTPRLQSCTGELNCALDLGKRLRADWIIAGNIGGLGDHYIINLKLIDVALQSELRRIQEPLQGNPEQLIEAIRVAAFRLVAPSKLVGSLVILADRDQARVEVNERFVGVTPLPPLPLEVGSHRVRVSKQGYSQVVQSVTIRLEKTSRLVVKLEPPTAPLVTKKQVPGQQPSDHVRRIRPWYRSWWFWTAVGIVAAGGGFALGYVASGPSRGVNCDLEPSRCGN